MTFSATFLQTRGASGASLFIGDARWDAAPPRITVQDSVGAGDACMEAGASPPDLARILALERAMGPQI